MNFFPLTRRKISRELKTCIYRRSTFGFFHIVAGLEDLISKLLISNTVPRNTSKLSPFHTCQEISRHLRYRAKLIAISIPTYASQVPFTIIMEVSLVLEFYPSESTKIQGISHNAQTSISRQISFYEGFQPTTVLLHHGLYFLYAYSLTLFHIRYFMLGFISLSYGSFYPFPEPSNFA